MPEGHSTAWSASWFDWKHFLTCTAILGPVIALRLILLSYNPTYMAATITRGPFSTLLVSVFLGLLGLGIVVPPLIYGVMVVVWGIDSSFIFAGIISLLTLVPFWWLVLLSRRLVPPLRTDDERPSS